MPLLELPEDVLSIVVSFLRPRDYLAFCQVNRTIYSNYRQDSVYWRTQTSTTFRLPVSPLLAADGPRWYWLYKRLKTQTQLYTWGQGLSGSLGPGRALPNPPRGPVPRVPLPRIPFRPPVARVPRRVFQRTSSAWPTEVHVPDEVGVIADLQCGGWSTTILSSGGKLFSVGDINRLDGIMAADHADHFTQLEYLTQSTSAVRSFSSGRYHILALTDDGHIMSWDRLQAKGLMAFPRSSRDFGGRPTRVHAGWAHSSAYVPSTGIVYWKPIKNDRRDEMLDGIHVQERVVPGTARKKMEERDVEVIRHIVLEDFIVWITSESKLWACSIANERDELSRPSSPPFEVPGYAAADRDLKDLQGQYQRFGLFTSSGEVLSGDTDYLRRCADAIRIDPDLLETSDWSRMTQILAARPEDIPAMQHTGVVALAYGDHHFLALHASGKITSYGRDSQNCGSLGLANAGTGGRFRGVRRDGRDAELLPIAKLRGREVWFEPEKKDWLSWLESQVHEPGFLVEGRLAHHVWDEDMRKTAAFSEWIEQEGRQWHRGPSGALVDNTSKKLDATPNVASDDYAHLGAYFPIAIAAAGWHSGALILVDEDTAHDVRQKWITKKEDDESGQRKMPGAFESTGQDEEYIFRREGFPKVRLPDGTEMPGFGELRHWREGVPSMQDLGLE